MTRYSELLKDPRWQEMRKVILRRDRWTCRICGDNNRTMHVHHSYYEKGYMPWEYPLHSLVTLCWECHETETEQLARAKKNLADAISRHGLSSEMIYQLVAAIKCAAIMADDGFQKFLIDAEFLADICFVITDPAARRAFNVFMKSPPEYIEEVYRRELSIHEEEKCQKRYRSFMEDLGHDQL